MRRRRLGIMMERAYEIEAVHEFGLDDKNRTIYISPSEVDGEVDEVMAGTFVRNMHLLEKISDDPIEIHLTTCGGSWDYGKAMYDVIRNSPCWVTTISHGWARSMSSIIPQAADERLIMRHCSFMAHRGGDGYEGNAVAFQSHAEQSQKEDEVMMKMYVDRCVDGYYFKQQKMGKAKIKAFLQEKFDRKVDWWLTAQEAVRYGFMDKVVR